MSTLQNMVDSAVDGGTVTLTSDVSEGVVIPAGKVLRFDLGGFTWSAPDGTTPLTINDGATVYMSNGRMRAVDQPCIRAGLKNSSMEASAVLDSTVELFGSGHSCVFLGKHGFLDTSADMTATNAAFCIAGNGSEAYFDSSCIVRAGTLKATDDAKHQSVAIYWPQRGHLYITGGNISGDTGIEVRAGEIVVAGGSIRATGTFSLVGNGNGSTTTGVALAVCQHTTKLPIKCSITGGIFNGEKAFLEANPQNNSIEAVDQIALNISGGNFQGAVESEDCTAFIEGGTFTANSVDPSYLASGIQYTYDGNVITYYVDPTNTVHMIRSDLAVDGIVSSTGQGVLMGMVTSLPSSAAVGTVLYLSQDKQYHKWDGREWVVEDMAIADDVLIPGSTRPVQTGVVEEMRSNLQAQVDNRYTIEQVDEMLAGKQNNITGAATSILNRNLATGLILQSDNNGKVVESSFPITSLNVLTGMESDRPIQEQLDEIKSTTSAKPLSFENRIVTAWTEVGETPYGYKGNLPLNDVTSQDYAQVVFNTTDSLSGKYAPYCETYDGGVYIWSTTNVAVTLPMVFVTKG